MTNDLFSKMPAPLGKDQYSKMDSPLIIDTNPSIGQMSELQIQHDKTLNSFKDIKSIAGSRMKELEKGIELLEKMIQQLAETKEKLAKDLADCSRIYAIVEKEETNNEW